MKVLRCSRKVQQSVKVQLIVLRQAIHIHSEKRKKITNVGKYSHLVLPFHEGNEAGRNLYYFHPSLAQANCAKYLTTQDIGFLPGLCEREKQ